MRFEEISKMYENSRPIMEVLKEVFKIVKEVVEKIPDEEIRSLFTSKAGPLDESISIKQISEEKRICTVEFRFRSTEKKKIIVENEQINEQLKKILQRLREREIKIADSIDIQLNGKEIMTFAVENIQPDKDQDPKYPEELKNVSGISLNSLGKCCVKFEAQE